MKYRPDIDGLRAIAVLLVLTFHAGFTQISSGFIGVDIFFVISGYLITSIITGQHAAGTFSFSAFYVRRLLRLQPAILAVVLFSLVLATIFYLPDDYLRYLKSVKYLSLMTANQFFERTTTAYAGPDTEYLMLLHTWSLAIEWQWYLFLPLMLWAMLRWLPQRYQGVLLVGLTFGSVCVAMWLSRHFPDKSYYFFVSRAFEFLIGGCVARFAEPSHLQGRLGTAAGIASLAVIGYCATRNEILLGFPEYHAVAVCLATAMLLHLGRSNGNPATRLLTVRPLVFVGGLSYSLYLWHWPIFALTRYLGLPQSAAFSLLYLVVAFGLSYLSYCLIEQPCRRLTPSLGRAVMALVLLPIVLSCGLYSFANSREGFPARFGAPFINMQAKLRGAELPDRERCLQEDGVGTDRACLVGLEKAEPDALLIGDSFSNHYMGFFDELGKSAGLSIRAQGNSSCLALPGIYLFDWWRYKNDVYQRCHDNTASYYQQITQSHYRYVIIGQIWGNYVGEHVVNAPGDERSLELGRKRLEKALRDALVLIESSGARPVLVEASSSMPANYEDCFYGHYKLRTKFPEDACMSRPSNDANEVWLSALFRRLAKEHPRLLVIDPKRVQCVGGSCSASVDDVPVYRDVGHLTDYASRHFGQQYLKRWGNPLAANDNNTPVATNSTAPNTEAAPIAAN
ncbi:acyltransferase family protein [Pseudomonas sp. NY15181]|uniref:acyltransferase family protein n=1 Tax=Pseudomonas sp. NY15181 TaxID=3400349 RepID=UPI003A889368